MGVLLQHQIAGYDTQSRNVKNSEFVRGHQWRTLECASVYVAKTGAGHDERQPV